MPTIKEIADMANVSRGTVDRVLNNRGYVSEEKKKKVLDIIEKLNYTPNIAGKTLAINKKNLRFGYILFNSTSVNPFFADVVSGIEKRASQLKEYNVHVDIRYTGAKDPMIQIQQIDELLESGISGLAITPINHPLVTERIQKLSDEGFPIITVNSDLPNSGRIAYVGSNYYKSGEIAAGIINLLRPEGAKVAIIMGSQLVLCQTERVQGFLNRIAETYNTEIHVITTVENNDDDFISYTVTKELLESKPEIDTLFLVSTGVLGSCRAVLDLGLKDKIKVICYDATVVSKELMRAGVIEVAITQEPYYQGRKPLDILLDYVGMGVEPSHEYYYTKPGIIIKENL